MGRFGRGRGGMPKVLYLPVLYHHHVSLHSNPAKHFSFDPWNSHNSRAHRLWLWKQKQSQMSMQRWTITPTRHNTLLLYQKTRHNTLLLFQETTHISPVSEATLLQKLKDCFPMCIELLKQEVEHIYIFRLSKCLEIKNLIEDNHRYSKLLWQWPVANLGRQRLLIKWTHYQCWKWWDWFSTGVLYFQLWYPCM